MVLVAQYDCMAKFDVKVRPTPDTGNSTNTQIKAGTRFQISEIVPDRLDPTNPQKLWGHIFGGEHDGKYTALVYPNNSNPISTYVPITQPPEEPGGSDIVITHTIVVFSDGSITVDGNPV